MEASQSIWHDGRDDPVPFIKYLLGTIIAAYRDFEESVTLVPSFLDTFRNAVRTRIGRLTKTEIAELCPSMSTPSVARYLRILCKAGEIEKRSGGQLTYYVRKVL